MCAQIQMLEIRIYTTNQGPTLYLILALLSRREHAAAGLYKGETQRLPGGVCMHVESALGDDHQVACEQAAAVQGVLRAAIALFILARLARCCNLAVSQGLHVSKLSSESCASSVAQIFGCCSLRSSAFLQICNLGEATQPPTIAVSCNEGDAIPLAYCSNAAGNVC